MNKRLLLLLPLVLVVSLFPSQMVPNVHASGYTGTGIVCITASATATDCPGLAPTIGPVTLGSTFTVGVFINNSASMGGFDIYVAADPSYLIPMSASLGSLIASPSLTTLCVNGSAQNGTCTVGTANGPGVVEASTIESSGSNECGGVSPCSGMAFTITYKVVGSTPNTSLFYPTGAGCSTSSVSSPPNTCALVDDAVGTTLPETIQGASVTVASLVCITSPAASPACPIGPPNVPASLGSTFTIGVRIENSLPMGGFDIYVSVDPNYLNPTSASLGPLIASPSLTTRCVNAVSVEGACTTGTANGPGVVEVSTIESSGGNECASAPCSGLAFNITYQVVGPTPSTAFSFPSAPGCSTSSVSSPANVCVLVDDATGNTLPENIQGASATQGVTVNPSSTVVSCNSPVTVGKSTKCTATITDTATTGSTNPTGQVTFSTNGPGSFSPNNCTLSPVGTKQAACFASYTPASVGTGTHDIGASYPGDTVHTGSSDSSFSLTVSPDSPTVSAMAILETTGEPVNNTIGVPAGSSVHDTTVLIGGYPTTGVGGTVTYTLYANGNCGASGMVGSRVTVAASNNVPNSPSFVLSSPGNYSFKAVYSGDSSNAPGTSSCQLVIVGSMTSSTITCSPSPAASDASISCVATVKDTSINPTSPSGTVSFTTNSTGTFTTAASCTLAAGTTTGTASCTVTYTPTVAGHHFMTVSYGGDSVHASSASTSNLAVVIRSTTITVTCSPSSETVGTSTSCTATVTDTSSSPTSPTGTVSFATDSSGTFSSATCTLAPGATGVASCSVSYTPAAVGNGTHLIKASYSSDSSHSTSIGTSSLAANPAPASTILGLSQALFYSIIGVVVVAAVLAFLMLRRRGKTLRSSTATSAAS